MLKLDLLLASAGTVAQYVRLACLHDTSFCICSVFLDWTFMCLTMLIDMDANVTMRSEPHSHESYRLLSSFAQSKHFEVL